MRSEEITNNEDLIDSRDVIKRINYLEDERADLEMTVTEAEEALTDAGDDAGAKAEAEDTLAAAKAALREWDGADELKALLALQEEAEGYSPDWRYGATLIRDTYFEKYTRELANDLHGKAIRDASWPFDHIDWDSAADALKQDYTRVEFDGEDYWVR